MRKIQRAPTEIFNLAFLDVISCAFGAVVLLILLAKNGDTDQEKGPNNLSVLIEQVLAGKQSISSLQGALSEQQQELVQAQSKSADTSEQLNKLESSIPRAQQTIQQLQDQAQSLREEIRLATARLNVPNSTKDPDDDVGGIPTDAEYVIFVIDNSGSMSRGGNWQNVISVVSDILQNHPKMKGFQIINADGRYLYPSKKGRWLTDSSSERTNAMAGMQQFLGGGSNPNIGMLAAINQYKQQAGKVSMYVFGDDYSVRGLEQVVTGITLANAKADGKPRFRIHGVGFYFSNPNNARGFSSLMQAVAKRNRGAFVGLKM